MSSPCAAEARAAVYRYLMPEDDCHNDRVLRDSTRDLHVRDVMVNTPKTVSADGSVADLRREFENPHVRMALLVDGPEFAGVVQRDELPADAPAERPARDVARRDVPTITPDEPVAAALDQLDARGDRRLVVLDADGRTLRGLLCLTRDRNGFCES